MRLFTLLIADAPIEDAFVYRTSLYCWTYDNRLRVYSIADLEYAARVSRPQASALTNYVLFHSKGLGASRDQLDAWYSWRESNDLINDDADEDSIDDPPIVIDGEGLPYVEASVQMESDALLDLLIYYDRLYMATNGGLYAIEPFDPALTTDHLYTERRVADACYSASAGLGTVAASCGRKGLRLVLDDFQWASHGRLTRKASDESVRAEIGYGSVVNHRSRSDYEFLATTIESTPKGHVLVDTRRADIVRSQGIEERFGQGNENIEFTFWDRSRLVMFTDGAVVSTSVVASDSHRRLNKSRELGAYGGVIGEVISAARVGRSFVVEASESIAFLSSDRIRQVDTGRIVSLRTYPNSHRYQRLATATSEKGLWIFGLAAHATSF